MFMKKNSVPLINWTVFLALGFWWVNCNVGFCGFFSIVTNFIVYIYESCSFNDSNNEYLIQIVFINMKIVKIATMYSNPFK